jgi:exopolysaccharide biosynthesis polyprenyl glycosylphosphotransferase
MRSNNRNIPPRWPHQLAHAILIVVAFWAAYWTKMHLPLGLRGLADSDYQIVGFAGVVCFHFSLRFFGVYVPRRKINLSKQLLLTLQVAGVGVAGTIFTTYLMHQGEISRLLIGLFAGYSFLFLVIFEYSFLRFRANYLKTHKKNILVIGSRHRATEFIRTAMRQSASGYQIIGCLELPDMAETIGDRVYESVKIIGTINMLESVLRSTPVDELVFSIPLKEIADVHEYIFLAESMGVNIRILPDFQISAIRYYPQTASARLDYFLGAEIMTLSSAPRKEEQLFVKSIIDYTSAAIGLFIISPLLAGIALAVGTTSPGGIFFAQKRCGLNGRLFWMYKFRTMVANAEEIKKSLEGKNEMDGPVFKMKNDPRITRVGRFLRATSLDELPQLFNVVKGEMSLVGPRPALPNEVDQYKLWQHRRLSMKPGLTCIWQVSGRNNIPFERWMEMDLEYIDNWSLKLDFILLLKTIKEVTVGKGR